MNKIKLSLLSVIAIIFISCNSNSHKYLEINQNNTELPIILRLAKDDKSHLIRIQFSRKIQLINKSLFNKSFVRINYHYNKTVPMGRDLGIGLFEHDCDNLISISTRGEKNILSKSSANYILYTRHFVDSTKSIQQQFKPYIEKMLKLGKDTLHIGTVAEFKQTHKELFESLTKNDSISIRLLDSSTKSGLGERIAVPVKW